MTRIRWWRVIIFALAFVYFLGPIAAAIKFSLTQDTDGRIGVANYSALFHNSELGSALWTTAQISFFTVVVSLLLMIPSVVYMRLRAPKAAVVMETASVLPIVIPPVVMAAGLATLQMKLQGSFGNWFFESPIRALTPFYVVMAMPFTYRSLDAGLRAIDLKTLIDAARSLGASTGQALWRVVVPNIRAAVLGSMFLTIALTLGEVILPSLLLYFTFSTQLIQIGQERAGESVAVSIAALLLTWLFLFGLATLAERDLARKSRSGRLSRLFPRLRPRTTS